MPVRCFRYHCFQIRDSRRRGSSHAPPAVDDEGLPSDEGGLVRGEIERHSGNFVGLAETSHGLARNEGGARFFGVALGGNSIGKRRRVYGSGTNRIAADIAADVI